MLDVTLGVARGEERRELLTIVKSEWDKLMNGAGIRGLYHLEPPCHGLTGAVGSTLVQ